MKYDNDGNLLWSITFDKDIYDSPHGITIDNLNNIYIAGQSTFDGSDYDVWTIKLDNSGNLVWNTTFESGSHDYGYGVTVDNNYNVYVVGYNWNGADDDFLLIKYSSSGNELWNTTYGGGDVERLTKVKVDSLNNIYVAGTIYDGVNYDYVVFKYNSSGSIIWNTTYVSTTLNKFYDIELDSLDNLYSSTNIFNTNLDFYVSKFD